MTTSDGKNITTPVLASSASEYTAFTYKVKTDLCKIEVAVNHKCSAHETDKWIQQLIFHHKDGTVEKLGTDRGNGRLVAIDLVPGERLIGAELQHGASCFMGITFFTLKKI